MKLEAYQIRLQDLVKETVTLLCKNALPFNTVFGLDALICVTPDDAPAFLLKLEETIGCVGADDDAEGERGDGDSSSRKRPPDEAARRKQSKRHRSDDDDSDDSSDSSDDVYDGDASDGANDSDHDANDADEANDSSDDSNNANDATDDADANAVQLCDKSVKTEPESTDYDKVSPNFNYMYRDDDTNKMVESTTQDDLVTVKQEPSDDDAPLDPADQSTADDATSDDMASDVSNVFDGSPDGSSSSNKSPSTDDAGGSGSRQVRDLLLLIVFLP